MLFHPFVLFSVAATIMATLLLSSHFIPAAVVFHMPLLFWYWFAGCLVYGVLVVIGVRKYDA